MKSRAAIAGHPIHPMLIPFPVALYVSTVVSLLIFGATGNSFWYRVAMWANVGGIVMGVVAAVPGLVDLLSLPRHSAARATGLRHAGFNSLSLVLFTISAALLWRNYDRGSLATAAPLVLSVLGVLSTMAAGWLGWTLTQTYHVGIKPMEPERRESIDELGNVYGEGRRIPATRDDTFRTNVH